MYDRDLGPEWELEIEPGPPEPTQAEQELAEAIGEFLMTRPEEPLYWRLAGLYDALTNDPRHRGLGKFQPDYDRGYEIVLPVFRTRS